MTAVEDTPLNRNYLSPLNYKFSVKKLPHVNFFLQKVNIPSLNITPTEMPNPFVSIPLSGDHIQYGTMTISFKLDERLENYQEMLNWIVGLGFPKNFGQYAALEKRNTMGEGLVSDVSIIVTDSAKNPKFEFIFVDAFPTYLSDLNLDTTLPDVNYITASATFKYTYFEINRNL
jgi:hypothetical protein